MVLHPEAFTRSVDPLVGVRSETVHVAPGLRDTAVTHQPGHLVSGLGTQSPEVPLHVVVTKTGAGQSLLRTNEVGELDGVLDEEHRGVVADEVVVSLFGVELHRKTARIAPGVRAALLTGDGREADERLGLLTRLQERGLRVLADVVCDDEFTESTAALGVDDALRDTLAVELRELLDQVVVMKEHRPLNTRGQRFVITCDRDTEIVGGGLGHGEAS